MSSCQIKVFCLLAFVVINRKSVIDMLHSPLDRPDRMFIFPFLVAECEAEVTGKGSNLLRFRVWRFWAHADG